MSHMGAGAQIRAIFPAFSGQKQTAGSELEQPELELEPIWEGSAADRGLACMPLRWYLNSGFQILKKK